MSIRNKRYSELYRMVRADTSIVQRRTSRKPLLLLMLILSFGGGVLLSLHGYIRFHDVYQASMWALAGMGVCTITIWWYLRTNAAKGLVKDFQNLLFAGAAEAVSEFMVIMRSDKELIYFTPSIENYFSTYNANNEFSVESLLQNITAMPELQEAFHRGLRTYSKVSIRGTLRNKYGELEQLVFELRPLQRPNGYFVLTATKDDISKNEKALELSHYAPTELNEVFDKMPWGIYKASEEGTLYYCNAAFAEALGYIDPGDLLHHCKVFPQLLQDASTFSAPDYNEQWQGSLVFQMKSGDALKAVTKQIVVPGDNKTGLLRCGYIVWHERLGRNFEVSQPGVQLPINKAIEDEAQKRWETASKVEDPRKTNTEVVTMRSDDGEPVSAEKPSQDDLSQEGASNDSLPPVSQDFKVPETIAETERATLAPKHIVLPKRKRDAAANEAAVATAPMPEGDVSKDIQEVVEEVLDASTAEQAYQALLLHSPLPVIVMSKSFQLLHYNDAFTRLLDVDQLQGAVALSNMIAPNSPHQLSDLEAHLQAQDQAQEGEEADEFHPIEIHVQTQNEQAQKEQSGDAVTTLFYAAPRHASEVQAEDGERVFFVIDISEQKELEERIIQSQKMQAVGQLAGGIAHDFNNLLTAMSGFCDLLLERHAPGDQSFADIMQIKQNANRAANLVRQLLAFSRKQTLQPNVVDLTDTLAELSNLIRRLIGENITLNMQYDRELWECRVDEGQMEQVIINLAVNARDAMEGKGELTIATHNTTLSKATDLPKGYDMAVSDGVIPAGDYVVIEVSDTGCGMSHELMHKVFDPFFTTKEVGEGTGLGLATVSGIIQQTGGYVFLKSKEGKGTRFAMYLPRHQATEADVKAAHIKEQSEKTKDLSGHGTILLVEDEDPVRMFAKRTLENKGYTVLEAENGEVALDIFASQGNTVDLIVSDVVMPGKTGPEMALKIMEDKPDVKVIFISGYGEDVFGKNFGSHRNFHFLPKPFTLKDLAGKVKDVMEKG